VHCAFALRPSRRVAGLAITAVVGSLITTLAAAPASAATGWSAASVSTLAGSGASAVTDGTGTAAAFAGPASELVYNGAAYVGDNGYIRRVDLATAQVSTIAGNGQGGCADNANPHLAGLQAGWMAADASYLYFVNGCGGGNSYLRRMSWSTGAVQTLFYTSAYGGYTGLAMLNGVLYLSTVSTINQVDTVAFTSTVVATVPPATGQTGTFLMSLTTDGSSLFAVDSTANRLVKINPTGWSTTQLNIGQAQSPITAAGGFVYGGANGTYQVAQYSTTDASYHVIAGSGRVGYLDGVGTQAWLSNTAIGSDGTSLYLADGGAHRLRKLTSAPALSTVQPAAWSSTVTLDGGSISRVAGGASGHVDGRGAAAGFVSLSGLHVVGDVAYTADYGYLRQVDLRTGQVSTVLGTGALGCQDGLTPTPSGANPVTVSPGEMTDDGSFLYFLNGCGLGDTYLRRMSLTTHAVSTLFYQTSQQNYLSLTVGPDGSLYGGGYTGTIQRIDTANATATTVLTLPTSPANTFVTIVGLTADSHYLYAMGSYDCGGYGGGCAGIYRVDPTSWTATQIYASGSYWDANYPSSRMVSAGAYLYGPYLNRHYADGSEDLGLGRWSKADGSFHAVTDVHLPSGNPQPFSYGDVDVYKQGLVLTDNVTKQVQRVVNLPLPTGTCGQCLPLESQGGGNTSEVGGSQHCPCHPVNTATGAQFESSTDLAVPGRGVALAYSRTYDSQAASQNGRLGYGWTDNYGLHLAVDSTSSGTLATAGVLALTQENGSVLRFVRNADGSYSAASRVQATLVRNADGTFTFTRRATLIITLDATGRLSAEKDLNGYVTTVGYDGSGRLSTITDPAGRSLTLAYNANNQVSSVTDTAGRSVGYGYDSSGNLTSVTDPNGAQTGYGYDSHHWLTSMTDPRLGQVQTWYDADGKVIKQQDAMSRVTTFDYTIPSDTGSWVVTITDPRGLVSTDTYDHANLVSQTRAVGTPLAATWSYGYDPVSNARTSVTDPLLHTWTSSYDTHGNQLSSSDPLGHGTSATYNSLNEPLVVTDANGVPTTNSYDAAGNLQSSSTPLQGSSPAVSAVTSYTYGDPTHPGDVTAVTDPRGKVWHRQYDSFGQLTSSTDPLGDTTTSTYTCSPVGVGCRSNVGWVYSTVSPRGNAAGANPVDYTTTFSRDDDGRVLSSTDPLHRLTQYAYDGNGNRTQVTPPDGHWTKTTFDADNEPTLVTRFDGSTQGTAFDADANMVGQTNGLLKTTVYGYDAMNRLATVTDPLNRQTSYGYDPANRLVTVTDPLNRQTSYGYDTANRRTSISYSDGLTPNVSIGYDNSDRRTSMSDGTGNSSWVFDSLGRLTDATNGAGRHVGYGYDLAGDQTSVLYPNGKSITRVFDDAGRTTKISDWLGHDNTFTPDPNGNLGTTVYGNGITSAVAFDHADQLGSITDTASGGGTVASFGYARNSTGQVTAETPTGVGTAQSYGYDTVHRLSSVNGASYGYDNADQLTNLTDGSSQSYDDAGQLQQAQPPISLVGPPGKAQDSGNGGSLSAALPTAAKPGDVVLLSVVTAGAQTVTTPFGYTARYTYSATGNQTTLRTYTHTVEAGDPASVTVSFGAGVTAKAMLAAVYRGVASATPVQAQIGGNTNTTATLTVPGVTSTSNGAELVLMAGETANATAQQFSTPTGMTDEVDANTQPLVNTSLFDQPLPTAGATGDRSTAVALPGNLMGALWVLTPIAPTSYGFDPVGDRTSRQDPITGSTSYGYDQASRLTSVGTAIRYGYDGTGLRASKTVNTVTTAFTWDASGGLPQLLDDGAYSYLYDPTGHVLEQIQNTPGITLLGTGAAQDNGSGPSLTAALPTGVRVRDQILLSVTASKTQTVNTPSGYTLVRAAPGTTSQTVVFQRTATGPETSATVTFGSGVSPKALLALVYRGVDPTTPVDVSNIGAAALSGSFTIGGVTTNTAGEQLVMFAGATGNTSAATWNPPTGMTAQARQNTQPLISTLAADQALTSAGPTGSRTAGLTASGDLTGVLLALTPAAPDTFYYQHDQLGSTRLVTSQYGDTAGTYSYDPYGNTTSHTGWLNTPFQYAGEYRDSETGLIYLRARYYDATTAQFLTRDPMVAETGSAYGYVGGDPLNASDPIGLMCFRPSCLANDVVRASAITQTLADGAALLAAPIPVVGEVISPIALTVSAYAGSVNIGATCLSAIAGMGPTARDCVQSGVISGLTMGFGRLVGTADKIGREAVSSANLLGDAVGWLSGVKAPTVSDPCPTPPAIRPAPSPIPTQDPVVPWVPFGP
jgi:RHS repeat-associated protein